MHRHVEAFYENKYRQGEEILRTSKQYTIDCVPDGGGLVVLDVGCGSGINSAALAAKGHTVCGVDISAAAIEKYRSRGFEGLVVDIEQGLGYPDESFDVVFCSEVIEHMTTPEALIADMTRVLKIGGQLVLSTPNSAFWLYRALSVVGYTVSELQHPKHFQFFSRRGLLQLVSASGRLRLTKALGRNMYAIVPDVPGPLRSLLRRLGFKEETRFRTGGVFWHLSNSSPFFNSLLADTLIVVLEKTA